MIDNSRSLIFSAASDAAPPAPSPLIILATTGTAGDTLPFIALGQGLQERGHRVRILLPAFQEATVRSAGLPYQIFGSQEQWHAMLDNPDLWHEFKGWGVIWNRLVLNLGALRKMIQDLPADDTCVVLSHPLLVPMAALARSVRPELRIVAAYLAPSNIRSGHDVVTAGSMRVPSWIPNSCLQPLWKLFDRVGVNPVFLPSLNAARIQYNLPPEVSFFAHILRAPNASLGLFPNWFAAMQPDWPQPFAEGNFLAAPTNGAQSSLSLELEEFLSRGRPPIVFTPGTGHRQAAFFFGVALNAISRLGERGVFVTPHAAQLPHPLPANVIAQAHAPFAALFPRTAAAVHHGGIGTTAAAFRAGIPQMIVPFGYDQFDNGFRAKRLGVADVLPAKRLSVGRMRKYLARLLASAKVKRACSSVAQKMAQGRELSWLLDRAEAVLFDPVSDRTPDQVTHT